MIYFNVVVICAEENISFLIYAPPSVTKIESQQPHLQVAKYKYLKDTKSDQICISEILELRYKSCRIL